MTTNLSRVAVQVYAGAFSSSILFNIRKLFLIIQGLLSEKVESSVHLYWYLEYRIDATESIREWQAVAKKSRIQ